MRNSQLSDKQQLTQRGGVKESKNRKKTIKKVESSYNISNKKSVNL